MNHRTLVVALSAWMTLGCTVATMARDSEDREPLKVFLQGDSAAELVALVELHGGSVTHDLRIIDAVGAILTPAQLASVLESQHVIRYFDDLSVSEAPDSPQPDSDDDCKVRGSLELEIGAEHINWRLYNKGATAARLERLELDWPDRLGGIDNISLGENVLHPGLYAGTDEGPASIEIGATGEQPVISSNGIHDLTVSFTSRGGKRPRQRDFVLEATFADDCSTKLIPGYDDNHENFHYNTTAGVEALHLNGVTGRGVTVAIIDSGLWEDRALAADTRGKHRILARYDAITHTTPDELFDASGHGTHMTSVIAHSGAVIRNGVPTESFKGVAPDANLVAVKAFDVAGKGDFLDIVRAVQWVVENRVKFDIRVLNLSFAARPRWPYWLDPINQAILRAWASGITVVAAAGNEGPELMTIGSPGNLPYIITVGAVTDSWTPADKGDDFIPDFSSRGPTPSAHIKPDIVAPGGHITGLTRPGSSLTQDFPEYMLRTGEFVMTGSSQASALAAGVVALLLQLEPDLSPDDIKCKLLTSAEPAINRDGLLAYSPFQQGNGYLNATRAVTLGDRGCGNADLDIHKEMAGIEHSKGPAIVEEDGTASLPGLNEMVSPVPAEKGSSETRKWGVKAHIEREDSPPRPGSEQKKPPPFDWMQLYLQESARIDRLSRQSLK